MLPPGTMLNTNGAGDSFTSGLLVATMLRHTGMAVNASGNDVGDDEIITEETTAPKSAQPTKKLTPYTLYMRENYVSLKRQCNGDKKEMFTKCHEMWENESVEVKRMYERMAREENEDSNIHDVSAIESMDSNVSQGQSFTKDDAAATNPSSRR